MRRRLLLAAAVLAAAWLAACAFLFLWPSEDAPSRVDAVVVLGGDASHRIPRGQELVGSGVAPMLVLSREPGSRWDRWRPLCGRRGVICFDADPYSTQGEAQAVARLAELHGWDEVALVTSRYHLFRARLLFDRCVADDVAAVGADYDRRWLPVVLPLETAKLVRDAVLDRSC
ncbi:MAG: YdcF family protein [Gaiellaceae bacterium]